MRVYKDKGQVLRWICFEISTPYLKQNYLIKFCRVPMYVHTHPNTLLENLRTGHTAWTLTEIDFTDGPYLSQNTTALTPSGTTGSVR